MKRILAFLLCAVLLSGVLPGRTVRAETLSKEQAVIQEAKRVYQYSRSSAGMDSFSGHCGLMVSHQLIHMGINTVYESYDGNKQFDAYAGREMSSGGYYITDYPATDYTLEDALNTITRGGTKDAYNMLVGFDWTSTAAGAFYGHAVVINAILDGTVYFVESFHTSLGGAEGNVITCSISEFADYFNKWMIFDGIIHFGNRSYADSCQLFGTNAFVRTRFDSTLRSEPCLVGTNGCVRLRSIQTGETLQATAVCKNNRDEMYYQVQDGQLTGYVAANAVSVVRINGEDLSLQASDLPAVLEPGEKYTVKGDVLAQSGSVSQLELVVTDAGGEVVLRSTAEATGYRGQLQSLNDSLAFESLGEGSYRLAVYGTADSVIVQGTGLVTRQQSACLYSQSLQVGKGKAVEALSQETKVPADGFSYQNGTWYCYENGNPLTGWTECLGVSYYLQANGAVTTGWAEIDGKMRYFSATGALCTGWLTQEEGITYRDAQGLPLTGEQVIEGAVYTFNESGILQQA